MHCVHLNLWITVMAHECYDSHLLVYIALKNSRTKIRCSCSWMPGFVPSLHHSRSPLISQHDDCSVLCGVLSVRWLEYAKKTVCFGCFGSCNNFFHFAIAIKMKLQIRWDFCLEIGARNCFPAWNPVFLPLLLSLPFHSKGKGVFVDVH